MMMQQLVNSSRSNWAIGPTPSSNSSVERNPDDLQISAVVTMLGT